MRVVGLPRSLYYFGKHVPIDLRPKTQEHLRYLSCWQALREQGLSSAQAAARLGLPRSSLYRWQKVLTTQGPAGLPERSRRPRRRRQPTWSPALAQAVLELREHYPRWGKSLP